MRRFVDNATLQAVFALRDEQVAHVRPRTLQPVLNPNSSTTPNQAGPSRPSTVVAPATQHGSTTSSTSASGTRVSSPPRAAPPTTIAQALPSTSPKPPAQTVKPSDQRTKISNSTYDPQLRTYRRFNQSTGQWEVFDKSRNKFMPSR